MIRAAGRIARFSLSGLLFKTTTVLRLRCRAGPACSRWSERYCVSLVSIGTPLTECPKAPCSRWSGRYCVSHVSIETPLTECPKAPCSRRSGRYCVSLVALGTTLSGCPKAPCSRRSGDVASLVSSSLWEMLAMKQRNTLYSFRVSRRRSEPTASIDAKATVSTVRQSHTPPTADRPHQSPRPTSSPHWANHAQPPKA